MTALLPVREFLTGMPCMLADHLPPNDSEDPLAPLAGKWAFDAKMDGIRALLGIDQSGVFIRNRADRDITERYPDLEAAANVSLPLGLVLDGEITSLEGKFHDINRRDRQTKNFAQWAVDVPAMYHAFDILQHPELGDVRHLPWRERRDLLVATVETNKRFEVTLCSLDPEFYGQLKQMGQEGVVAKRLTAPYRKGRSADWLKFKICRDVSVVAVGYDYGEGKRAEIGAVHMAMLDEDGAQAVFVGKVGSGFTDEEIAKVKSEIDAQRLPVLEVTTMGLTRGDVLREPRFKGFRTDLVLHEVTVAQLSALPKG